MLYRPAALAALASLGLLCSATVALAIQGADDTALLHARIEAPALSAKPVGACGEPDIVLSPIAGGLTQIAVSSSCRAGELVSIAYSQATLVERLDAEGRAAIALDCFAGDAAPVAISFEDGKRITRQPVTDDLSKYSKVAIVWSSSIDLNLHAFEYAAAADDPGHIAPGKASSLTEAGARAKADKRGHGYLSTESNGTAIGMNVEVYTFVHYPREKPAGVKIGVEFATRGARAEGEYCGTGRYAEVRFKAFILERGRVTRGLDLAFAGVPCGTELGEAARINSRLIPELTIRE